MDDRAQITLDQLEHRREDSSRAMWLAPGLTMAAQAFLLQVLANGDLSKQARSLVLVAAVVSTTAAFWSLARARAREVQYSEEIQKYVKELGLGPIRPSEIPQLGKLDKAEPLIARVERWAIVRVTAGRCPPAYMLWAFALAMFILADIAVFCAASSGSAEVATSGGAATCWHCAKLSP